MIKITFEAHGTTFDNEAGLFSGQHDVGLSPLGEKQSAEMGVRYANRQFDAIFCSDLKRSYNSANIAFAERIRSGDITVIRDKRLNEIDCGPDWTGKPVKEFEIEKAHHLTEQFSKGESYSQTTARMKSFLKELLAEYDEQGTHTNNCPKVMIIGHRATQYALDHLINKEPLENAVTKPWKWQPGWTYYLKNLQK
ncbi:MAG: hypothetical protein RIT04_274 [Candidatus Parcubacteria bacterium]|jgi:broad specificity phosphatase PhoE